MEITGKRIDEICSRNVLEWKNEGLEILSATIQSQAIDELILRAVAGSFGQAKCVRIAATMGIQIGLALAKSEVT